jgi:hypothetical protein
MKINETILEKNVEYESFNKKFIITTTQKLLLTLFSNKSTDKLTSQIKSISEYLDKRFGRWR